MQVATQAVKYSKHMSRVRTVCIYGGAPYPIQNRQLSRPFEILVATPGRLIDHMDKGRIDFSRIELFVLDEADRMLDMGFIHDVKHIADTLPKEVQTVLFSATLEGEILKLSKNLLSNPAEINLASNTKKHENIEQILYYADNLTHKMRLLEHLLKDPELKQAIIFTSTKAFANELSQTLREHGHHVGVLHGDLDQRRRTSTTRQFREGNLTILVATDVAARGIDIPAISHVINFDLPPNVEDYVHRIGRTGRADAKGIALSLALGRDKPLIARIEKLTGKVMASQTVPGLEPSFKDTSRPKHFGSRSRGAPHRGSRGDQRGDQRGDIGEHRPATRYGTPKPDGRGPKPEGRGPKPEGRGFSHKKKPHRGSGKPSFPKQTHSR